MKKTHQQVEDVLDDIHNWASERIIDSDYDAYDDNEDKNDEEEFRRYSNISTYYFQRYFSYLL